MCFVSREHFPDFFTCFFGGGQYPSQYGISTKNLPGKGTPFSWVHFVGLLREKGTASSALTAQLRILWPRNSNFGQRKQENVVFRFLLQVNRNRAGQYPRHFG